MNLLIDLHYFPCIDYFTELTKADSIYLEACENFQKQSYRNRCYIATANKVETLTIPVIKSNSKKIIREIEIDYSQDWQKIHWRSIQSAYGKAPFFEYYSDYIIILYDKKPTFLWEFNIEVLSVCLKLLKLKKNIIPTETYNKQGETPVRDTIDKRSLIHPKTTNTTKRIAYNQVFGKEFEPNLSIIDLILNEGPSSLDILNRQKQ